MRILIYTALLLAAVTFAAMAQEAGENHLDIIFVIDASGSMNFTDPDEFRKVAAKAFIDITQDRGGDRIGVVQFAGWNETMEKGALLYPLSEIPHEEKKRDQLLAKIKKSIGDKASAFGKGTDFNFAFEKAIADILEERDREKNPNKAWIILLTDGTTDVKEGGNTRKEYLEAAGEKALESRKALNDAAQKYFEDKVLPQIAKREDIFITCINLTEDEPSPELKLLSEKTDAKIIKTTREALKGIFIEALSSLPKGVYRSDLTRGFGYTKKEAAQGKEASFKFRIYEGSNITRALIFSNTTEFTLDLKNQEGKSISDPWSIKLSGAGESYRVISITNNPPGEYTLIVNNKSSAKSVFETLFFTQFDLKPAVKILNKDKKLQPGEKLQVVISLLHKGKPIKDLELFKDLEANHQIGWSKTGANAGTSSFIYEPVAMKKWEISVPEYITPGKYRIRVVFRGIKNTLEKGFAFTSREVNAEFSVVEKPVIVAEKPEKPAPHPEKTEPQPEIPEAEPKMPEPETRPQPKPEPVPAEEPLPDIPPMEKQPEKAEPVKPAPEPVIITVEKPSTPIKPSETETKKQPRERKKGFSTMLAIAAIAVIALIGIIIVLLLMARKPGLPPLEFNDQQLWSASGDARLLGDFGDGPEVTGTPEIPEAVIFRLSGTPEKCICEVMPGPKGKLYIDNNVITEWYVLQHRTKIEVEAAGRPEVPVYKYTYFERDPSPGEKEKAVKTKPVKKREESIKPEDIFPTDMLTKEDTKGDTGQDIPLPEGDDELIIFDDD